MCLKSILRESRHFSSLRPRAAAYGATVSECERTHRRGEEPGAARRRFVRDGVHLAFLLADMGAATFHLLSCVSP
jgi:hypothetical protein